MAEDGVRRGKPRGITAARKKKSEENAKVLDSLASPREQQIQRNISAFFDKKPGDKRAPWETEGKGLGPAGEMLTLEDLISLRPFTLDELGPQIGIRISEKMLRSFQRIKENCGGAFDIMSDLYREALAIGLLVLNERHKQVLGIEIVISRAKSHQTTLEEAKRDVRRLKEAIQPLSEATQLGYFKDYITYLDEKPKWAQEAHLEEIRNDLFLSNLLRKLQEEY